MFDYLIPAAQIFFTIKNLLVLPLGLFIGITIGAIPGLNVPMTVALLLPITFYMEPVAGIILLLGVYKGGTYGGSISAILINTPGAPAAVVTSLDGYPLAQQGKAGKALRASIYGSVIGEFFSDLILITIAGYIAMLALKFGPTEKFALIVFALSTIGVISSEHKAKGIAAGIVGIFIHMIGADPISGSSRFMFGIFELIGGIPFLPFLIGLFAISEFFIQIERKATADQKDVVVPVSETYEDNHVTWQELKANLKTIARSSLIGLGIGALPGSGSAISAFVSYGAAKNASKHPERFGKGSLEGVFAAETGNNSVCGGALIPLLTLGIPGDAITAIMIGVFLVHGLIPGPDLFVQSGDLIYAVFIGLLIANIFHFFIASLGLKLFIKILSISRSLLFPTVMVICIAGAFTVNSSVFDVYVMVIFGVVGYVMKKFHFPIAPLLMGYILGPLLETSLVQTLVLSNGSLLPVFTRPISLFFVGLTLFFLVWTTLIQRKVFRKKQQS
ncbi:C4-dicarboxylate ABC transporter permease [candidate division KSB3 bacterium]|uniref:C4-dicarboxylate ABC transporter permease n=1 Tax=candidate division KSB3 bacterium TaxID=2044937 RepID=A0A9D5Q6F5_9BACT|nr:C4-dicarboxylate ABC transporter permease [candidate division KSB3 bacterium]MBD3324871.1 C4-dicarboxylate ABC transporter permease [candidate division KSB3 bacterium]